MKHLGKCCLLLGVMLTIFGGCENNTEEMSLTFEINASQDCYRAQDGLKLHFSGLPPASSSQLEWRIWLAEAEEAINISENNLALKAVTGTYEIVLADSLLQDAGVVVATVYFFLEGEKMQTRYHSYSKTKDPSDCVAWEETNS